MKIKLLTTLLGLLFAFTSCEKWISIRPTDRLSEDVLFENKEGYLKALNGVYVELANPLLYGQFMSTSVVDVLAQYYFLNSSTQTFYDYTVFNYSASSVKTGFDSAWKKSYALIANTNILLEKCGNAPSARLPERYYNLIKGETLALRAMLHFDLLRLFGPIYNNEGKSKIAIPYATQPKPVIYPLLTAEEVLNRIIDDLTAAQELLLRVDPILTEGVKNTADPLGDNTFNYRQYRLNYFAATALLARAYLWKGDHAQALQYAKEIIQKGQQPTRPIFPMVTFSAATDSQKPDRLFFTEVLFGVYTLNRVKMYDNLFSPTQSPFSRLSFNASNADRTRVEAWYEDKNDYRYRVWENSNVDNAFILTNQKYKDYQDAPGQYMIPLIRMSEAYLIAAECAEPLAEATAYLNAVRTSRNIFSVFPADRDALKNAITNEYQKEFLGEGQMFFYYKRNASQTVPNNQALTGTKNMSLTNYVVPIPDSELR
ncbi:RagB/SusD family nutrient uptake outer membrane protein [Sphingobacterium sp. Mn56C]|uniref:RagB/SusD family nutrient uptake outer membrane protein n=1 Tax=Sphingobacterium sp. Mn56C TaxID=3395261 RepID=UPI003BD32A79